MIRSMTASAMTSDERWALVGVAAVAAAFYYERHKLTPQANSAAAAVAPVSAASVPQTSQSATTQLPAASTQQTVKQQPQAPPPQPPPGWNSGPTGSTSMIGNRDPVSGLTIWATVGQEYLTDQGLIPITEVEQIDDGEYTAGILSYGDDLTYGDDGDWGAGS